MLEDNIGDIFEKARKGRALSEGDLCRQAAVSPAVYAAMLRGAPMQDSAIVALSEVLSLFPEGLLRNARGTYRSTPSVLPTAIERVESIREGYVAHAYLLKHPFSPACLLFDTGFEAAPILSAIQREKLLLKGIFITHAHPDHIGGLSVLKHRFPRVRIFAPENTQSLIPHAEILAAGERILFEKTQLRTLDTAGHTAHALAYVWENTDWPVVFAGDALFAGSMGGAQFDYKKALSSARALLELPPETLVCPGHGPFTTVAYERQANPFVAEGTPLP